MLIYSSVRELARELGSGSVVLIPSELLSTMSKCLSPALLTREDPPRLRKAPFYVMKAPTLHKVTEMTRYGFKIVGEISPEASVLDKIKAKFAKIKSIAFWERREMAVVHPYMIDEHYIQEVAHAIHAMVDKHPDAFAGSSIFLYMNKPDYKSVDLLSRVRLGYSIPLYVALPINLSDFDEQLAELVRNFIRNHKHVALLLGVEPREVLLEYRKDVVIRKPLTQYLIQNIVENALRTGGKSRNERLPEISNITASIMDVLFDDEGIAEKVDSPEWKFSISTVHLDTLKTVAAGDLVATIREHPNMSSFALGGRLYELASIYARNRMKALIMYMHRVGVPEDVVKAVRRARWILNPEGFADARHAMYAAMWKKKDIYTYEEVESVG